MSEHTTPPGWGEDEISRFLAAAHDNTLATFVRIPNFVARAREIDALFRKIVPFLGRAEDWLPSLFFLRAHSAFLGAVRLVTSGQPTETYMVLRGALEAVLYAHYIAVDPSRARTWFDRGDSPEARQAMKREFLMINVLGALKTAAPQVHERVAALYERTIDYGAHPNPAAFLPNMTLDPRDEGIEVRLDYLVGPTESLQLAMKTLLQTGVAVLKVFQCVIPQRFELLGIDQDIQKLARGL